MCSNCATVRSLSFQISQLIQQMLLLLMKAGGRCLFSVTTAWRRCSSPRLRSASLELKRFHRSCMYGYLFFFTFSGIENVYKLWYVVWRRKKKDSHNYISFSTRTAVKSIPRCITVHVCSVYQLIKIHICHIIKDHV